MLIQVVIRGELMPRIRTDGFNENQIESESKGKGEHCFDIAMVVSRAISRINRTLSDLS